MRKPLFLFTAIVTIIVPGLPRSASAQPFTYSDAVTIQQDGASRPEAKTSGGAQSAPLAPGKLEDGIASPQKLGVGGKFRYFAGQSFSPGSLLLAGAYTGLTMANPPKAYPREWRQGAAAFGRNSGDFMASWTALQGGKFVVASALHEDPRYFRSQRKNWIGRGFHAIRFAVIDQSDSGHPRLAVANLSGALAGGFVGNAYLPDGYNNSSHAWARSAYALGGFATTNLAAEFHPEIVKIARKLHLPFVGK